MDPAGTEHLQNISPQEIMLGNHEQSLCEVMEALRGLTASVTNLGNRLDQVYTQLSVAVSRDGPPPPNAAPLTAPMDVPPLVNHSSPYPLDMVSWVSVGNCYISAPLCLISSPALKPLTKQGSLLL